MDHGGGLRSRVSHNSPSSSAWGATADPYQAPAQNPYGGFDGVADSHLKEVGSFGGFGGGGAGYGSSDPFGGDPAAGFSAYDRQKKSTPWAMILIATGVGILLIVGIFYMMSGETVATPAKQPFAASNRQQEQPPPPPPQQQQQQQQQEEQNDAVDDDDEDDPEFQEWDEQKHSRTENVVHEEMRGANGKKLSNNLKGLSKKARMFLELDQNKDAFLAGADIPKATLELLDVNKDMAISFDEWTHGFDHIDEDRKLQVFKTFYGQVYGDVLPSHWTDREHFVGDGELADDRHLEHEMDAGKPAEPVPAAAAAAAAETHADEDVDPGEMTDEELNAALDKDFDKMDSSGDGAVTLAEYKAWDVGNADVESDYHVLDRNHDGKLTRVELSGTDDHSSYQSHEEHEKQHNEKHEKHLKNKQEAIEKAQALGSDADAASKKADDEADEDDDDEELEESQLQAEFDRMDTDKDLKVSEDEYVAWAEQANPGDTSARHNFRLIDRNKSSKLTFRELFPTSIRKTDLHYHEEEKKSEAATPATEATPPPPVEANDSQAKFAAADVNGDGRLSAAEADSAGLRDEEGSVKADTNRDGFVDYAEFEAVTKT